MMCTFVVFFFSSRRRHTRYWRDWSSDVCSSDLSARAEEIPAVRVLPHRDAKDGAGIVLTRRRVVRPGERPPWTLRIREVPDLETARSAGRDDVLIDAVDVARGARAETAHVDAGTALRLADGREGLRAAAVVGLIERLRLRDVVHVQAARRIPAAGGHQGVFRGPDLRGVDLDTVPFVALIDDPRRALVARIEERHADAADADDRRDPIVARWHRNALQRPLELGVAAPDREGGEARAPQERRARRI